MALHPTEKPALRSSRYPRAADRGPPARRHRTTTYTAAGLDAVAARAEPAKPRRPGTLLVGTARVDRSGRVHERSLLRALGREPGHEVGFDTTDDMIVITSVSGGRYRVDDRGAPALPAAARRMCGITPGPPVVLVAAVHEQILLVHPTPIVARLLAAHHATLIGGHDAR